MATYYLPADDAGRELWLKNFANKLPTYAAKYNLSGTDTADMSTSAAHFTYWLNYRKQFEEYLKKLTAFKNESRDGFSSGVSPISTLPSIPTVAGAPAQAAAGIFPRATSIAARIKAHKDYSESDGQDLGLIAPASSSIVAADYQSKLTLEVHPGNVVLKFTKNGVDGVNIYARLRGESLWQKLSYDSMSPYIDNRPLAVAGQPEIREYTCIGVLRDEEIGQRSDIAETVFGG